MLVDACVDVEALVLEGLEVVAEALGLSLVEGRPAAVDLKIAGAVGDALGAPPPNAVEVAIEIDARVEAAASFEAVLLAAVILGVRDPAIPALVAVRDPRVLVAVRVHEREGDDPEVRRDRALLGEGVQGVIRARDGRPLSRVQPRRDHEDLPPRAEGDAPHGPPLVRRRDRRDERRAAPRRELVEKRVVLRRRVVRLEAPSVASRVGVDPRRFDVDLAAKVDARGHPGRVAEAEDRAGRAPVPAPRRLAVLELEVAVEPWRSRHRPATGVVGGEHADPTYLGRVDDDSETREC